MVLLLSIHHNQRCLMKTRYAYILVLLTALLALAPITLASQATRSQYQQRTTSTAFITTLGSVKSPNSSQGTSPRLSSSGSFATTFDTCSYDSCKVFGTKRGAVCTRPSIKVACNDARCNTGNCMSHGKQSISTRHGPLKSVLQSYGGVTRNKVNVTTTH